jgi:hypothetical protein
MMIYDKLMIIGVLPAREMQPSEDRKKKEASRRLQGPAGLASAK